MTQLYSTPSCYVDVDGERYLMSKDDLLFGLGDAEDWIKLAADVEIIDRFEHLILHSGGHKAGHSYLLVPILGHGVHGKVAPVFSTNCYLCTVEKFEPVSWGSLTQQDKEKMLMRYPHIKDAEPEMVGRSVIRLVAPIKEKIIANVMRRYGLSNRPRI